MARDPAAAVTITVADMPAMRRMLTELAVFRDDLRAGRFAGLSEASSTLDGICTRWQEGVDLGLPDPGG